jgi:hypothetical protein
MDCRAGAAHDDNAVFDDGVIRVVRVHGASLPMWLRLMQMKSRMKLRKLIKPVLCDHEHIRIDLGPSLPTAIISDIPVKYLINIINTVVWSGLVFGTQIISIEKKTGRARYRRDQDLTCDLSADLSSFMIARKTRIPIGAS